MVCQRTKTIMGFNLQGKVFEGGHCPKCHTGKLVPYPEWRESVCYLCGYNRYWDEESLPRLYHPEQKGAVRCQYSEQVIL